MKNSPDTKKYINRSKKGFTLTELIVSIMFVAVIMGAATYAYLAGNHSFQNTGNTSKAYGQARSLETMFQNAASSSPSLVFTEDPLPNGGGNKYSHFYFDNTGEIPVYRVTYYGNSSVETPAVMEFDAIDEVIASVINRGRRCELKYRISSTDDNGSYYIEGGIILNNIDADKFTEDNPGTGSLPPVLNFLVPEA